MGFMQLRSVFIINAYYIFMKKECHFADDSKVSVKQQYLPTPWFSNSWKQFTLLSLYNLFRSLLSHITLKIYSGS